MSEGNGTNEPVMHLKVPPPIVGLVSAAIAWLVNVIFPSLVVHSSLFRYVAVIFLIIGLLVELVAVYLFIKSRTTVNPMRPDRSRHLVTQGLYRWTRNPMYLGMLMLLLGFVLWQGSPLAIIGPVFFVSYLTIFQIQPEEQILLELFGDEYSEYKRRVRRWL